MNFPARARHRKRDFTSVRTQGEWIHLVKTDSCESCHQLGNQYTRTIPAMFSDLDPAQAWIRRVQSGQAGAIMTGGLATTRHASAPRRCSAIGPRESRTANCPPMRRRVRRAPSATS